MEYFCNCNNVDVTDADKILISWEERFNEFKKEPWFKLWNSMWWKHQSTFKFHIEFIHNDIMKLFRLSILQYDYRAREMHVLAKHLSNSFIKG